MIKQTLFSGQIPSSTVLHPMEGNVNDLSVEAERYGKLLPDAIDFMLLSMGEDGHIASLFPRSSALTETQKKIIPIHGPKAPYQRLTITPMVIKSAKQVFVLALGDEKRRMYEQALEDLEDIEAIPARLVLDRTWIFDLEDEVVL
jgi:6-phosphogluconolactonase